MDIYISCWFKLRDRPVSDSQVLELKQYIILMIIFYYYLCELGGEGEVDAGACGSQTEKKSEKKLLTLYWKHT